MATYELVVIGGGPAGATAARSYLDAGGEPPVLIVSSDNDKAYWRPPLSKEGLASTDEPPNEPVLSDDSGIEWRLNSTVTAVDVLGHTVRVGGDDVGWQRLIVASGSTPLRLDDVVSGVDPDADVHVLRTLTHGRDLSEAASHARSAVVVGSGFIGCEATAALARRGIDVTLVTPEESPQVTRLGSFASEAILEFLKQYGVTVVSGVEVTGVTAPRTVHLSNGRTLSPDLLLAAVGVRQVSDFLEGTGVQTHEGRIVADDHLRTNVDDIWVAGDVARGQHSVAGRNLAVEHWGDALAMGEVAGTNAAGGNVVWADPPGFWSEIGEHQLKYSAWGDGFDEVVVQPRTGGFTVWYGLGGDLVGVLTHNADDDYERGAKLLGAASLHDAADGAQPPEQEDADADADE